MKFAIAALVASVAFAAEKDIGFTKAEVTAADDKAKCDALAKKIVAAAKIMDGVTKEDTLNAASEEAWTEFSAKSADTTWCQSCDMQNAIQTMSASYIKGVLCGGKADANEGCKAAKAIGDLAKAYTDKEKCPAASSGDDSSSSSAATLTVAAAMASASLLF